MTLPSTPASNPTPQLGFKNSREQLLDQILKVIPLEGSSDAPALREQISCSIDNFLQRQPKPQTREVSVLIADVKDFASLAEVRPAEDKVIPKYLLALV